ncbi:abortive infection AbiH-like protein [Dyadobacter jejuensis]|uniref:Abortive infection AbiH-like protein n=1 Tax=Dyadobacter jejuensis TaxID=1082580 RepID=A0A316APS3_9BACT|nr:AbiH family protein [Dyadobacter jejuensis]PWJ59468.1 abortive infection AbiH-like protein [Dyadobacter jejuensis]
MNRVVIIGNGFDVAHRLQTKYVDFVNYLKQEFINYLNDSDFNHRCLNHPLFQFGTKEAVVVNKNSDPKYFLTEERSIETWQDLTKIIRYRYDTDMSTGVVVSNKNFLLNYSFGHYEKNSWGGFENDYKDLLLKLKDNEYLFGIFELPIEYTVEKLNEEIGEIMKLLYDYLIEMEKKKAEFSSEIFANLFTPPLFYWGSNNIEKQRHGLFNTNSIYLPHHKEYFNSAKENNKLNTVLFLNFNYTSTIEQYLLTPENKFYREPLLSPDIRDTVKTLIRYIHGSLKDKDLSTIIFGYGDELGEYQSQLENSSNEFLKHVKSVLYTRKPYYREMIDFINSEPFDIVIYGHSCSNTDRTLLNTLFEHENCISIQPYIHDKEDLSIYTNIYRCFKDKTLMRSRVVDATNTISIKN